MLKFALFKSPLGDLGVGRISAFFLLPLTPEINPFAPLSKSPLGDLGVGVGLGSVEIGVVPYSASCSASYSFNNLSCTSLGTSS